MKAASTLKKLFSGVISEFQFRRMGVEVDLVLEIRLIIFSNVVIYHGHGHDEGG